MTFSTNVPNASQSPGVFPAQANTNFTRLKTIIDSNHKFNDTAAVDDGYHENVKMLPQANPGADASVGQLFASNVNASNPLKYTDGNNVVWQVTPCLKLLASVVFTPGSPNAGISYSFNVSQVVKQGSGIYRVSFTTAASTANYYWSLNIIPSSSSEAISVSSRTSTSPSTGSFDITARKADGSASDTFVSICALFYGG